MTQAKKYNTNSIRLTCHGIRLPNKTVIIMSFCVDFSAITV